MRGNLVIDLYAYKQFMDIKCFPHFDVEHFKLDLNKKYISVAQAVYDSGKHILRLPSNYETPRPLLYHELTHIYDMETLKSGEKIHDFCLTGYMEYHASQVDLMVRLGANSIKEQLSFSTRDSVNDQGLTVTDYMESKFVTAVDMLNDSILNERLAGLGLLYNFLGLRSICLLYALDYKDNDNFSCIANRLDSYLLSTMKKYMVGWNIDVNKAVALFSNCANAIQKVN